MYDSLSAIGSHGHLINRAETCQRKLVDCAQEPSHTFDLEQIHDNCREREVNLVLQLYILFLSCYARLLRV